MKIQYVGRHSVELRDDKGNLIDSAKGRTNIMKLKDKYNLWIKNETPPIVNEGILTGFE